MTNLVHEPISRWEFFMSGFSLELWLLFMNLLPWLVWTNDCNELVFDTELDDAVAVEETHECMKDHRDNGLAAATFLLLGYPIIIAHCYYEYRVHSTVGAFLNIGLSRWIYFISWIIGGTILCTVIPSMMILVHYYEWEFGNGLDHVGYAMQLQFLHFTLITYQSLIIPFGIAAGIPWIWHMIILIGDTPIKCCQWYKSSRFELTVQDRKKLFGTISQYSYATRFCLALLCLTFFLMCIFGTFTDSLNFDKDGFFSDSGGSNWLFIVLFLSWQIQAIVEMRMGFKLDTTIKFLNYNNSNSGAMSTKDSIGQIGDNNSSTTSKQMETFEQK